MKFNVGDRVIARCWQVYGTRKGTVSVVNSSQKIMVKLDDGELVGFYPQQCRKLKKKKRRSSRRRLFIPTYLFPKIDEKTAQGWKFVEVESAGFRAEDTYTGCVEFLEIRGKK